MKRFALILACATLAGQAQTYTRGIGVYPGDPKEYTGPSLVADAQTYRNLALHRPAYQSSAYDYNLTAQLITDGIKESSAPQWIETSTSDAGALPKNQSRTFPGRQCHFVSEFVGQLTVGGVRLEGRRRGAGDRPHRSLSAQDL